MQHFFLTLKLASFLFSHQNVGDLTPLVRAVRQKRHLAARGGRHL